MILGFNRREMDALYDDIIAFSGLEQYQYMLLRNFSSGMRVKLAFATAAQIKPDILVLDEVLSVGDITFREKSRQKILDFCKSDKTVVIVSHSMSTISGLCDRVLFLQDGKIQSLGRPEEVINAYIRSVQEKPELPEISFAQGLMQYRTTQRDYNYVRNTVSRITELDILSLVRNHYNADIERSLNEYLTWEYFRKNSYLDELFKADTGGDDSGSPALGAPAISFLKNLGGDVSGTKSIAQEIIRRTCPDGFFGYGNEKLTASFSGSLISDAGGRIVDIIIRDRNRTVPVIFDTKDRITINHIIAENLLKTAQCDPEHSVLILSPELSSSESLADLLSNSIRFTVPVPLQDIEKGNFDPAFFEDIICPENLLILNDKPVFGKRGRFEIMGNPTGGFGYFDPRRNSMDYQAFFTRLAQLRNIFGTTARTSSLDTEAFISQIAKRYSVYFSGSGDADPSQISFRKEAVLDHQKLMGMIFLYHSGAWDAEMCYRYHEIWRFSQQSFNFYNQIMLADDAFHRGKNLVSLINSVIKLEAMKIY